MRGAWQPLRAMRRLLDLLLPPSCPGCGKENIALCDACRAAIARRADEPGGISLGLPASQPAGLVQLEWCCSFSGPARAALHALKYDGELRLVPPLARLMSERWRRAGIGGDLLVPVPVHLQRKRERGFDQAELLARHIGPNLNLPVRNVLQRQADTRAQHRLTRGARATNVARAFVVGPSGSTHVLGRWIVLVDDVVTTGATLSACADALRGAGAAAVSAVTLARER